MAASARVAFNGRAAEPLAELATEVCDAISVTFASVLDEPMGSVV